MPAPLMKSVSGIRGVVGESLTPALVANVAAAFAAYVKQGLVVIGRDARPTGNLILLETAATLAQCGCNVIDLGIVPTPTVELAVKEYGAAGGIVISASHNPIEWNAFKLINAEGLFLNEKEIKRFFVLMEKQLPCAKWNEFGFVKRDDSISDKHIKRVLDAIDTAAIKRCKFTVALDSVNGAGSEITKKLLEELGCRVIPVYCRADGTFPRGPEPVPDNLSALCDAVKGGGADIGFAQDPDADRLAVVNEAGRPIGEEYTVALVCEYFLEKHAGGVAVVNMSTTKAVEDIARQHGGKVLRSKVGEINVSEAMKKVGAVIGGEGNGGVISPEIHLGRDSLAGIGYILNMMALRKQSVSALVGSLPSYVMKKGKIPIKELDPATLLADISEKYKSEKQNKTDGLRIDFSKDVAFAGGWVHLRPSNTEPVFRIIAEGKSEEQASAIYKFFSLVCAKAVR